MMRISTVTVKNFRSIKSASVSVDKFSIFVGQNNHGKTNLFEAIEWFDSSAKSSNASLFCEKDTSQPIEVEIKYVDVQPQDIEKLSTPAHQTSITKMLGGETEFVVKKTSINHKKSYFVNGVDMQNPTGLDAAVTAFLPKLEYITTRIKLEDVSQYKDKNPIGQMLSGVLTAIIDESEEYKTFKAQFTKLFEDDASDVRLELNKLSNQVEVYLQKQFPGNVTVRFTVNPPQFSDLLKSFDTSVNDGVETKAEDKGDGMQRAIMLSIIQAFSDFRKKQVSGSKFLFLIDEAELHLHPSAQRLLKQALIDISETDQVMLNTHSSVLVVDEGEDQKLFKVEKIEKYTEFSSVDEIEKPDIIFELLGGSPYDLLLPKNFMIVEGKSEFDFLSAIIKRFYKDRFKGLKILFSGGDVVKQTGSIEAIDRTLRPLVGDAIYRDKLIVLLDKPNARQQGIYNSFKTGYSYLFDSERVFELPVGTLEEYYPSPWTKTAEETEVLGKEDKGKTKFAKTVADEISQSDFESHMVVMFDALQKCEEKSFK